MICLGTTHKENNIAVLKYNECRSQSCQKKNVIKSDRRGVEAPNKGPVEVGFFMNMVVIAPVG